MLERIVENWLTSLNERQYQIPFCQLLQAEGERVIYISTHGQAELGTDVLTLTKTGKPRAYQLKRGDIALADWRKNEGEIVQLVEYDPSNPALTRSVRSHDSFLVTNGVLRDPVLGAIARRNTTWKKRRLGPLRTINRDDLVSRFVKSHEKYFPTKIEAVSAFLELYVEGGSLPLDKEKFASFLEAILPEKPGKRQASQAASSVVLLTSYILKNKTLASNHWAIFEAWVMAAAHIMTLGETSHTQWSFSVQLCRDQATAALVALAREVATNPKIVQGVPLSDGSIYSFREVIVCGLLSALYLSSAENPDLHEEISVARSFCERTSMKLRIWGESAVPMIFVSALALEQMGKQSVAEQLVASTVYTICVENGKGGNGIPNPYWSPERCLRRSLMLSPTDIEKFEGFSYTLESLIAFLARRLRRSVLKSLWERITRIDFAATTIAQQTEWFYWNAGSAGLVTYGPNQPESWERLREASENQEIDSVPELLREDRALLIYFTLVYPHRFCPPMAFAIEKAAIC